MNTIRCSIVEDLLPLYIDGALREETAQAVREHLSACPACRNEYEKLAQTLTLPSAPDLQEEDRRAFQAFRRHWKRKKLQVALLCVVLTAAVVIAGCVVYQEVEVVHDLFSPPPRWSCGRLRPTVHGHLSRGRRETGCGLRAYLQRGRSPWMPTATARSHSGCGMTSTTLWWTS